MNVNDKGNLTELKQRYANVGSPLVRALSADTILFAFPVVFRGFITDKLREPERYSTTNKKQFRV